MAEPVLLELLHAEIVCYVTESSEKDKKVLNKITVHTSIFLTKKSLEYLWVLCIEMNLHWFSVITFADQLLTDLIVLDRYFFLFQSDDLSTLEYMGFSSGYRIIERYDLHDCHCK